MKKLRVAIIVAALTAMVGIGNSRGSTARPQHSDFSLYETLYFVVNTTRPPLDNVMVRYALAMATDRRAIANTLAGEETQYLPSTGLVPPYKGYDTLKQLEVVLDGKPYDVLRYDPVAARELLSKAGFPGGVGKNNQGIVIEMLAYEGRESSKLVETVKQQWKRNLGVEVRVVNLKWHDYLREKEKCDFNGVALEGKSAQMTGPALLLDFASGQTAKRVCWVDPTFGEMLRDAKQAQSVGRDKGSAKFRQCEAYLLRAMPVIPLYSLAP